jgi:hypothetical protein
MGELAIGAIVALLVLVLLTGCSEFSPAMMYSHTSNPLVGYPVNNERDTTADMLGAGGCWSSDQTDGCIILGERYEVDGHSGYEGAGFATQAFVLHKFKVRR